MREVTIISVGAPQDWNRSNKAWTTQGRDIVARIHPDLMNSVCLLTDSDANPIGTSFLYGYPSEDNGDPGYTGWLVTCKHVVLNEQTQVVGEILVSLNRHQTRHSQPFNIPPERWTLHPTADIAVTRMSPPQLEEFGVDYSAWAWELTAIGREGVKRNGLHEGDEVFSVGFPIGFREKETENLFSVNYPLVRVGVLAQIRGWLQDEHPTFLVDCPIFDGNSGGPICTIPSSISIGESSSQKQAWLIGVATRKLAGEVSATGLTALDLGVVTPIDFVNEAIQAAC